MPKKSTSKHTQTPWWTHESPNDYEATLIEGNHRVIAAIRSENESKPTQEEIANADFILRACNSHEELVETIEDAIKYMDKYKLSGTHYAAMKSAFKSALRKAQGK